MVAVPTSKLRLAEASCSAIAALLALEVESVSLAASTSKYACATRTIRSCSAVARSDSATSTPSRAWSIEPWLGRLKTAYLAFRPALVTVLPKRSRCTPLPGGSSSERVELTPTPTEGRASASAWP